MAMPRQQAVAAHGQPLLPGDGGSRDGLGGGGHALTGNFLPLTPELSIPRQVRANIARLWPPSPGSLALHPPLLLPSVARGQTPNPELPRARQSLEELRYAEASTALEAARARPGNDRGTLLQILELQGVVAATLRQQDKARTAFQTLLSLAPAHQLVGDYSPRVMTPFFEARAWVDEVGALRWRQSPQ